ncbi:MFS transporter [Microbacterium sp. MC2]
MTPAPRPLWRGRAMAVTGVLLLAFSLRSAVASLSPVLARAEADFAVPTWVVGLIGSAPPVCFAIFGLLTPALERRLGLERLALVAIVVAAVGMLARALAPDAGLLLLATALVFAACGVGNVLLPPFVKAYFPDRIFLVTGVYTTVLSLAVFVPAFIAVPVADAAGWRVSLGVWAVIAVGAVIPWAGLANHARRAADVSVATPRASILGRMSRIPMAWALALAFGSSSAAVYTMAMWLPQLLTDRGGLDEAAAGALLGVFGGIAGLMFAPGVAPWLWVTLLGLTPLYFPLALVLLGLRTRTHEAAVALSGFVQSIGYAIAAMVPLAFGVLHELTGSWIGPLGLLAVVITASIPAGFIAARTHTVEEEWERRGGRW